ncbi:unnamed protein product [Anisakis simplex]|uniref:Uncharacterized protein n=1 Tax=Anisakis simplex TaxID=6269 RepID=A0A3P6QA80_ANISI|nr:unnamed protein product [Anisakis simplex]
MTSSTISSRSQREEDDVFEEPQNSEYSDESSEQSDRSGDESDHFKSAESLDSSSESYLTTISSHSSNQSSPHLQNSVATHPSQTSETEQEHRRWHIHSNQKPLSNERFPASVQSNDSGSALKSSNEGEPPIFELFPQDFSYDC